MALVPGHITLTDVRDEIDRLAGEVSSVASDLISLLHLERELARAEMEEQKKLAVRAAGLGLAGLLFGLLFTVFGGLTLVFALATFLPEWAAALIVTLGFGVLAAIAAWSAMHSLSHLTVLPRRFFKSIAEDIRWVSRLMASSSR